VPAKLVREAQPHWPADAVRLKSRILGPHKLVRD
jgi:hypothetical protein